MSLFIRLSESTLTIVTAAPTMSIGRETGVPWKLAPERVRLRSAKNIGLSPTPFSSISTCVCCSYDLRCGAHRVCVLDLGFHLSRIDISTVDACDYRSSRANRPRESSHFVQERVVRLHICYQGFEGHCSGDFSLLQPSICIVEHDGTHSR